MPEPQVTVRTTEAGRVTEVVVPDGLYRLEQVAEMIRAHVPRAQVIVQSGEVGGFFRHFPYLDIRQPGGPDVVALAGETLRIAAGRVERVREDGRYDDS